MYLCPMRDPGTCPHLQGLFILTPYRVAYPGREYMLFPNRSAMARVLSLWRSIEKKGSESETSRQSRQMSGYNTNIQRPFASLELARCVKHQSHARRLAQVSWV